MYFEPSKSIVIQLKCAELVPSAQFSAGLTTRFPRVINITTNYIITNNNDDNRLKAFDMISL